MTSIPADMLAARCLHYNSSPPLDLVRVPVPSPSANEVLVKITAASLCHTDVTMCMGHKINEGNKIPQTAGHEPCGVIAKLGSGVKGFKEGDRVGFVNHGGSCGTCEECRAGMNTYCLAPNTTLRGVNTDGCFSEYAVGDATYTFKLPDKLSDEQAAPLMCAGVTAYAAVKSLNLRSGQWMAVVGCGGLGHLAIQFAKTMGIKTVGREYESLSNLPEPSTQQFSSSIFPLLGAKVDFAPPVDVRDSALSLAKKVGVEATVDCTTTASAISEIRRITGEGVHGAILLADSQSAMELAAEATRKHGTVCLVAAPPDPWKISPLYLIHKDLKFTGSLLATPQQCRDMLKLVEENDIHIETKTYPFDQVNQMIADAKSGKTDGRLVLKF